MNDPVLAPKAHELTAAVRSFGTIFTQVTSQIQGLLQNTHASFELLQKQLAYLHNQTQGLVTGMTTLAATIEAGEELSLPANYSLQRINHLVASLQYQDIIHQRLEHIQQAQEILLAELPKHPDPARTGNDTPTDNLVVFARAVQVQAHLLQGADKDYQQAFRKLRASLEALRQNTRNVIDVGSYLAEWLPYADLLTEQAAALALTQYAQELVAQITLLLEATDEAHLFQESVRDICQQLRNVEAQLPASGNLQHSDDAGLFKQLEQLFTMQSERVVLERVIRPGRVAPHNAAPIEAVELF